MYHRKLDKWLQPGGHCDGYSNILNVAIKEAIEESGINEIKTINRDLFDIDTHYLDFFHSVVRIRKLTLQKTSKLRIQSQLMRVNIQTL
nr:hypothetical protein [Rickettsia sp. TH2014]